MYIFIDILVVVVGAVDSVEKAVARVDSPYIRRLRPGGLPYLADTAGGPERLSCG